MHLKSPSYPLPGWTTQCSGDLGIAIQGGQIVAQAFIHPEYSGQEGFALPTGFILHIFDIIAGGPHRVMPLAEGLEYMQALARHYSARSTGADASTLTDGAPHANHPSPND